MGMMSTQASNQPAFRGALFDSSGACVNHPDVKLSQKVNLNGRVVFKEVRRVCPKCLASDCGPMAADTMNCTSSLSRSAQSNSSNGTSTKSRRSEAGSSHRGRDRDGRGAVNVKPASGGSVRSTHERRSSGTSEGRPRSRSRSRPSSRSQQQQQQRGRSDEDESKSTTRSKSSQRQRAPSVGRSRTRKEYDTPFDSKGRCHYHAHVQLAKKKIMGGWNVLLDNCPKCIEENYINDTSDNRSDTSRRSNRTAKSSRSVRSTKSVSRGRVSSRNSHQCESPFDCNGYCNRHNYVRLAKKKTLGGWKIIQSFCPECVKEDSHADENASERSGGSRQSRRSGLSKSSRVSKSSRRSGLSRYKEDETESAHSTSQSEQVRKKLVKKMAYCDAETGEEGLYTGYVNGDYQPHGRGKMAYENGERYDGTWCEGTKVHGKTSKSKDSNSHRSGREEPTERRARDDNSASREKERSSSRRVKKADNNTSHDGSATTLRTGTTAKENPKQQLRLQQQMDQYRDLYTDVFPVILETKTVKNMKFVDFYGDAGRYTGEVNEARMPHGMGEMTYDHGLVQGGKWTNGVLDEGSIVSCPRSPRKTASGSIASGDSFRRGSRVRDP